MKKISANYSLKVVILIALISVLITGCSLSFAEVLPTDGLGDVPSINVSFGSEDEGSGVVTTIQVVLLLSVLTLAPSILIMMTCFTRFIIVLSFVRRALSLQTTPPNQVLIGLALFLTFFVMQPTLMDIKANAYDPMVAGEITAEQAIDNSVEPIKDFMLRQVRTKDLKLFVDLAQVDNIDSYEDVPMTALIPAFIISELKTGFEIGFLLFVPFIVIDMIVASTLMALGMMMLPPVMISLPFKILLFIMVDGWNLIIEKLLLTIR